MKIGFLIHRTAYYQYFSSIIDEALKRGHEVVCIHDYTQPKTGLKGYNFPYIENAPKIFIFGSPKMLSFSNNNELIKIIKENSIEVVVSIHFSSQYNDLYRILKNKYNVFWVAIQHSVDGFFQLSEQLNVPDRNFFYSDIWCDWAVKYILSNQKTIDGHTSKYIEKFKNSVRSVGFPELDQLSIIDPEKVRHEWNIPDGKPVVLLLPSPTGSYGYTFWNRFIYGMNNRFIQLLAILFSFKFQYLKNVWYMQNDANVIKAVKKFCDNNDAYLLVKSRRKDPVRAHLSSVADKVLYDESYYPTTILKCLSISNICIHFFSTTVTEAVPVGVPSIFIAPPHQELADLQQNIPPLVWEMLYNLMDYPGVSYKLSIPEAIKILPDKSIQDFPLDLSGQKEYIKKFLRYSDGKSSCRMLDEIEELIK